MNDDELKDAAHSAFDSAMAFGVDRHAFERLARTVRDAEREACAKVCDQVANETRPDDFALDAVNAAADAIRKRSNA